MFSVRFQHVTGKSACSLCILCKYLTRTSDYCSPTTATWLSILEMASTYLLPFICTLIVDLGVLIWSKHFTTCVHAISRIRKLFFILNIDEHHCFSHNSVSDYVINEKYIQIFSEHCIFGVGAYKFGETSGNINSKDNSYFD